ncbi:MAG: hypothetical protein SFV32_09825 [Opitutaceae bacterium]|nr:hypothetical protein [Opitutaceae bacterium]
MAVVPLTLTISLCLVFTFVVFFLREQNRRRFGSCESEALLPLNEETPRADGAVVVDLGGRMPKRRHGCSGRHAHSHEAHDGEHKRCEGCTRGDGSCQKE